MAKDDNEVSEGEGTVENVGERGHGIEDEASDTQTLHRPERFVQHPDGRTVTSVLTDEEALGVCGSRGVKHDATVLWQTAQLMLMYPTAPPTADGRLPLLPEDVFSAHKYAMAVVEARGVEAALADAAVPMFPFRLNEDVVQVFDLLRPATTGDALPPPHLRIPGDDATLILALETGKDGAPDAVNIYDETAGVSKPPVARVTRDSTFTPTAGVRVRTEIVRFFRRFARNPVRTAAYYGRQSGICCYCGRALSSPRSVEAGYGPDCAARYSLPW